MVKADCEDGGGGEDDQSNIQMDRQNLVIVQLLLKLTINLHNFLMFCDSNHFPLLE